jgi:NADH-quinone oxidoreductase subunit E
MHTDDLDAYLVALVRSAEIPREKALDVMFVLQRRYGYLCDEALERGARILGLTPLELEELATFYDFIYREPVGRYVIHVCDGVVCWMHHGNAIFGHLRRRLGVELGQTSADGMFTLLPVSCIGDCHNAPSMLINGRFHGRLTPSGVDRILEECRHNPADPGRYK